MYYQYNKPSKLQTVGAAVGLTVGALIFLGILAGIFVLSTCTWDYKTGRDTGYISAVDKKNFSDDRMIYLRRRPLNAQNSYVAADDDESVYCTTADRTEVIEKAYEAMTNNKRVILIYDEPRPFGWRAIGHCNSAPITDIQFIEE